MPYVSRSKYDRLTAPKAVSTSQVTKELPDPLTLDGWLELRGFPVPRYALGSPAVAIARHLRFENLISAKADEAGIE